MYDGRIVIDIESNTKGLDDARKKIQEVEKDIVDATSADLDNPFKDLGQEADGAKPKIANLAKAIGLAQIALKALSVIIGSISGAVSRFDTLNQFPKVMEQMGFGADESKASIDKLSEGIQGLPTTLDSVVSTTQRFATAFRDVDKATETTLALNNALLASGANQDEAARSTDQYVKMMSSGKVEMDAWNTLSETMNYALTEVSGSLGYSTENTWELYSALQNGEITLDDFNTAMIEASNAQGGFAETALVSSEGLGTSWTNIKTAIVNGVANMITALDDLVKGISGASIAQHLNRIKNGINIAFRSISQIIKGSQPVVEAAVKIFEKLFDALVTLSPIITGVVTAFAAFKVITSVVSWFAVVEKAVWALTVSSGSLSTATALLTSTQVAATTIQKTLATAYALLTGQIGLATVAKKAFAVASSFVLSPVGAIVTAIGLGVGAFLLFKDSIFGVSDEMTELVEMSSGVTEAAEDLTETADANREAFEKNREEIDSNETSLLNLVGMLETVTEQEQTTAAEREKAKEMVNLLNGEIEGLNLVYDEEANALSISTEALRDNIEQRAKMKRGAQAVDRWIDLELETTALKEQLIEIETALEAVRLKREELGGGGFFGEKKVVTEELDALKNSYNDVSTAIIQNEAEIASLEGTVLEYTTAIAATTESETGKAIVALENLSDAQRAAIDNVKSAYGEYSEVATSAFDEVATASETSISEMIEISGKNREAMLQMTEDVAGLRDRFKELGLDEAIIDQFANAGVEAPGLITELVNATDGQLAQLVTNTDTSATDLQTAFAKMFDIDMEKMPKGFTDLISNVEIDINKQLEESGLSEIGTIILDDIAVGLDEENENMTAAGKNITDSTAKAIDDNSDVAKTAGSDLGQTINSAFAEALGIASPSRVFIQHGVNIVLGATRGVSDQASTLLERVKKLAVDSAKAFSDVKPQFEVAGRNVGRGFNDGLASMRGDILATARDIARSAAQAINRELIIKSPSRVTFQSGADTGEGFELGLLDKIKDVEQAGLRLAQASLPSLDLGKQFTTNYVRHNLRTTETNYISAESDRRLTNRTNQTLGEMKYLLARMAETEERILQKETVLQAFFDKREVTKELDEPLNDYRKMNEERKQMLDGVWI